MATPPSSPRPALPPSSFSSSLPGAWSSTWSISEMTPVESEFRQADKAHLAMHDSASNEEAADIQDDAEEGFKSARVSLLVDDTESIRSEDFYSMASDSDSELEGDSTLLPSQASGSMGSSPMKVIDVGDTSSILAPLHREQPSPTSSGSFEICSSLHRTTPEEGSISGDDDEQASEAKPVLAAAVPYASGSSPSTMATSQGDVRSTRIFLRPPSAIDPTTSPRTSILSTSTSNSGFSGRVSSSASADYGDDDDGSDHESDQGDDDAHDDGNPLSLVDRRLRVPLTPTNDKAASRSSLSIHTPLPPPPSSSRNRRSALAPLPPAITRHAIESELDITALAQPDGNDPWTLSLDPTLASINLDSSTSRSSVVSSFNSISVTDSSVAHDNVEEEPEEEDVEPSRPHSQISLARAVAELLPSDMRDHDDHVDANLPIDGPSTQLPHARPSTSSVGRPPSTLVEKKTVAQKTKSFYLKVKKFFAPKPAKLSSKGISNDPFVPQNNIDFPAIPDTPTTPTTPTARGFSSQQQLPESQDQFTVYRRSLFMRTRKGSSPSIARSFAPGDYTVATPQPPLPEHRPSSALPDERYTYEYHARPKTLEEIKAAKRNRRISLPTGFFGGSTSSKPASRPGSRPGTASSRPGTANGGGGGRTFSTLGVTPSGSSLHVPQQRWPQPTPSFRSQSRSEWMP